MQLFHVSKYLSVPICAAIVWVLVVKGDYKTVEKFFLVASVIYLAYIGAGVVSHPDWHEALKATIMPPPRSVWSDKNYIYLTIGVIGTTIAPWMQFYLQSSVVDKGITIRQYKASRLDVIVGCFFTDIVAWFIIVACAATLYTHGMRNIQDASEAAGAMKPLAGDFAFILFAAGCSMPRSSRRRSCRCRRRIRCARDGLRERTGQEPEGGAVLLLVLHGADRAGRGPGAVAKLPAGEGNHPVAGAEWRAAAGDHDLHAEADQQARADGKHTNSTWFNWVAWRRRRL